MERTKTAGESTGNGFKGSCSFSIKSISKDRSDKYKQTGRVERTFFFFFFYELTEWERCELIGNSLEGRYETDWIFAFQFICPFEGAEEEGIRQRVIIAEGQFLR